MANSLNLDLTGRVVVFKAAPVSGGRPSERPFLVRGGLGAMPHTASRELRGVCLSSGQELTVDGGEVERLATLEEFLAANETLSSFGGDTAEAAAWFELNQMHWLPAGRGRATWRNRAADRPDAARDDRERSRDE